MISLAAVFKGAKKGGQAGFSRICADFFQAMLETATLGPPLQASMIRRALLLTSFTLAMQLAARAQAMTLVASRDNVNSPIGEQIELLHKEVLRRLGLSLELRGVPAARATLMAKSGEADGIVGRVAEFGTAHRSCCASKRPAVPRPVAQL